MSWIEKLYRTYENNTAAIGNPKDSVPLLPICHTTQNAHITIVIDRNGNFQRASVVPRSEARTIIPATEKSAGRTSGPEPHPLCDKLQYVAADYRRFGGDKKPCFEQYSKLLNKWIANDKQQWKLKAVAAYIAKGRVISDLVESSILYIDKAGKLLETWPDKKDKPEIFNQLSGESWQADAFIRWSVETPGDPQPEVWLDKGLWRSWESYYRAIESRKGLCFVTGAETELATQHPAKIRSDGDKAKLISSNDLSNYTFRGRFTAADEACGVGFQVTQKAHYALRWLIARQGRRDGEQAVVAWAPTGSSVPDPQLDTLAILFQGEETGSAAQSIAIYTAQEVSSALSKKIAGYSAKMKATDDVVVLELDAASPGRMAISYYRELTGSDYLKRIEDWHKSCCWLQSYEKDRVFFGAPAPRDIAEVAYGVWRGGKVNIDDNLKKKAVDRLLPCIIDGMNIPRDIVDSCVRKATNRHSFSWKQNQVSWEWEKALGIACAVYRKANEKEGYGMALDENRKSRDYLYGRLLALAESMERWALNKAGEDRPTSAERLMQRFADHPYSTWRTIELSLVPYKARLGGKSNKRQALIDTVHSMFDPPENFTNDNRLSGEFLLGYHCQRAALRTSNGKEETPADASDGNASELE